MILNSKVLNKMDASCVNTCSLCPVPVGFFSKEDFLEHNQEFHRNLIADKLKELESSKKEMSEKLVTIKGELRNLYKKDLAKKETVELVQHEIQILKRKIKEKDRDIKQFRIIMHNERCKQRQQQQQQQPTDTIQLVQHFKEKWDKEFYCLLDSISSSTATINPKKQEDKVKMYYNNISGSLTFVFFDRCSINDRTTKKHFVILFTSRGGVSRPVG